MFRHRPPTSAANGGDAYPVLTNRPGVFAVDLVRRIRWTAVLFATALAAATVVGSYVATTVAGTRSEQRVAATAAGIRADMDRRTADRKRNDAIAAAIFEQNRRTLCSLMREVGTHDEQHPEIDVLYRAYSCGTADTPVVPPGWTPPPGWPALPGSQPSPPSPAPGTGPSPGPGPGLSPSPR